MGAISRLPVCMCVCVRARARVCACGCVWRRLCPRCRAFAHKALGNFESSANDFETAKAIAPENPLLVVNYLQLHTTPVIELCKAGQEVY